MNYRNKCEVANLALETLNDNRSYWLSTSTIWRNIQAEAPSWMSQAKLRDVLNELRYKGTIVKDPGRGSKHRWRLAVTTWDKDDPMTLQPGAMPMSASQIAAAQAGSPSTSDDDDATTGHTDGDDDTDKDDDEPKTTTNTTNGTPRNLFNALRERVVVLEDQQDKDKETITSLSSRIEVLTKQVESSSRQVKTLEIKRYDGKVIKLKDVILPEKFQDVLDLAKNRENTLLVGPAGCGKSYLAKLVAKALGLDFYKVGGSGGLSEEHLLGYSRPNLTNGKDKFVTTPFLTAFESGGLCLVDELDGANENALLCLNPALDDSNELPVPNREANPLALKNEDFVCCGTANTIGRGATREYVGRNQLDEAFLDRFRTGFVEIDYDPSVEAAICPNDAIREWCQSIRKKIHDNGVRRIMSTRFMAKAYKMHIGADWSLEKIQKVFFAGWSAEERGRVY